MKYLAIGAVVLFLSYIIGGIWWGLLHGED